MRRHRCWQFVHNVQIRGGAAIAPIVRTVDACQYRFAVIWVDQLAGAIEVGIPARQCVPSLPPSAPSPSRRTIFGALVKEKPEQDHVRKVRVGAAEADISDLCRCAGTIQCCPLDINDPLVPKIVSKLPELLILPARTRLDAAASSMPPTRIAPLCPAPSSTTEQPYSVGELLPLVVAIATIPGVVRWGLKPVSRVAVPEPLVGGIRRSTTPTGPTGCRFCPTITMLPVPGFSKGTGW